MVKGQGEGEKSEETQCCRQSEKKAMPGAVGRDSLEVGGLNSALKDKRDVQGGPHRNGAHSSRDL